MGFSWDAEKNRANLAKHGISFEQASQVFDDPSQVVIENYFVEEDGEQRQMIIGMSYGLVLIAAVFVDRRPENSRSLTRERRKGMSRKSIKTTYRRVKVSDGARALYAKHDHSRDDPESPVLPPEVFEKHGVIGKFYRPLKKQTTVRIDADVLEWLKSKGEGHLSRVNEILRHAMIADLKQVNR